MGPWASTLGRPIAAKSPSWALAWLVLLGPSVPAREPGVPTATAAPPLLAPRVAGQALPACHGVPRMAALHSAGAGGIH